MLKKLHKFTSNYMIQFFKKIMTFCAVLTSCVLHAQLTVNAGNDTTVCAGSPVVLGGAPTVNGGTAPYSYYWSPNVGLSCDTCANPVATANANSNYVLMVVDAIGDTISDTIGIAVNRLPQVSITGPDTAVCRGQQVYLQGNANIFACGAALPCANTSPSLQIGNGTTLQPGDVITYPSIFGNYAQSCRQQLLYKGDELLQVLGGPKTISTIGFFVEQWNTNALLNNFTIKMGCTSLDSLTDWDDVTITVLNSTTVQPGGNWNDFALNSSFYWDGSSNLVVEICFNNPGLYGNQLNKAACTITPSASYIFSAGSNNQCDVNAIPSVSNIRPNMHLGYCSPTAQSGPGLYSWQAAIGADSVFFPLNQNTYILTESSCIYYLTVTDNNGCTNSDSIQIDVRSDSIHAVITVTNASCSSLPQDGAISAIISSPDSMINYIVWDSINGNIWSGTALGNDSLYFPLLQAGIHHLFLNDGHCGSADYTFYIDNDDTIPPTVIITVTAATCGLNNGKVRAIVFGMGITTYQITDSAGVSVTTGNGYNDDTIKLNSLYPGLYHLVLNGCFYLDTTFGIPDNKSGTLSYVIDSTDPTCPFLNNGVINAILYAHGDSIIFKLLDFNSTAVLDSGVVADSGAINFTSLVAGTYPLVISDSFCTALYDITLFAPLPPNYTGNSLTPSCYGDSSSSGCVNIAGGTQPFSYVWSDPAISGACPYNMAAGNYKLTVTDANNCSTVISDIIVLQNPAITYQKTGEQQGPNTDSVTLSITGGSPPYTVFWGDGGITQTSSTGGHLYTTATLNQVTIQDSIGCYVYDTIVSSFSIGILQTSSSSIIIFPNPATGQLFIESNEIAMDEIEILDITGKQVLHQYLNGAHQSMMNIPELTDGVYLLNVRSAGLEYRSRFVKAQ
jgi:hypothetical protein